MNGNNKIKLPPRIGIGVILVNEKGQMLLGRRTSGHGFDTWGNPGGHLEFGESFEACAMREVREEIGVEISEPSFLALTSEVYESTQKHYVSVFMVGFLSSTAPIINREPHKTEEWVWVDMKNPPAPLFPPIQNLVSNNTIVGEYDVESIYKSLKVPQF